jgi:nucleoside-diphosphate-sugar epimerase
MALTIAVTGADGFIGRAVCVELEGRCHRVRRITRTADAAHDAGSRFVPDVASAEGLETVLAGCDAIVHLAARAHVLKESEPDPEAEFERVNVGGTVRLAEAAVRAGLKRFVFVSSIGVNGSSSPGAPFTEADPPAPAEPYARSKLHAERALLTAAAGSLEVVIVRPPMVYGPGVKGNFLRLMSLVDSGLPLPLGSVRNRRSVIGVENLAALLALCSEHHAAAGELFLAAEPEVHSTPGLLRAIAGGLGRPDRVFGFPFGPLRLAAQVGGVANVFEKLCGSLEVSASKAQRLLDWRPTVTFPDGIARTAGWYRERRHAAR